MKVSISWFNSLAVYVKSWLVSFCFRGNLDTRELPKRSNKFDSSQYSNWRTFTTTCCTPAVVLVGRFLLRSGNIKANHFQSSLTEVNRNFPRKPYLKESVAIFLFFSSQNFCWKRNNLPLVWPFFPYSAEAICQVSNNYHTSKHGCGPIFSIKDLSSKEIQKSS